MWRDSLQGIEDRAGVTGNLQLDIKIGPGCVVANDVRGTWELELIRQTSIDRVALMVRIVTDYAAPISRVAHVELKTITAMS